MASLSKSASSGPKVNANRTNGGDQTPGNDKDSLEQEMLTDMTKSLKSENRNKQLKAGSVVGATLGVSGLALLGPLAAVPLAAAGVVGGWSYVKMKNKESMKHIMAGDDIPLDAAASKQLSVDQAASNMQQKRPHLRRLKFLTRWARMLIDDDEEWDRNIHLLDDVIAEFSPWVQQLYLERAKNKANAPSRELQRCKIHLAPLYEFLQKSVVYDAFQVLNRQFSIEWDTGRVSDARMHRRCRVVLTTVYETTNALKPPQMLSNEAMFRLDDISDWISHFISRPDIKECLSRAPRASRPMDGEKEITQKEEEENWPPQNADWEMSLPSSEDEAVNKAELNEEEFFSADDLDEVPIRKVTSKSSVYRRSSIDIGKLPFSREGEEHSWCSVDAPNFKVRGPFYLLDKVKIDSAPSMFDVVDTEIFQVDDPVMKVANHRNSYRQAMRARGDNRFLLIISFLIPPLQLVVTMALPTGKDDWPQDPNRPETKLWNKWLTFNDEEKSNRFKIIPCVREGPWLARKAVGSRPVLCGNKFDIFYDHQKDDYIEIVMDTFSKARSAQGIFKVLRGAANSLVIDMAFVLEAQEPEELPERLWGGFKFSKIIVEQLPTRSE